MYFQMLRQMRKHLAQVDSWFDATVAFAKAKSFDPDVLLIARLSPDQFAFARQVQIACDTAKLTASRLSGKEALVQADTEKTLEELRARVRSVIEHLDTYTEADFAGAATRSVTQARWQGKTMSGNDYFFEHAVPNFYFHLSHVYALLRHNGVSLGKAHFLGALSLSGPAG